MMEEIVGSSTRQTALRERRDAIARALQRRQRAGADPFVLRRRDAAATAVFEAWLQRRLSGVRTPGPLDRALRSVAEAGGRVDGKTIGQWLGERFAGSPPGRAERAALLDLVVLLAGSSAVGQSLPLVAWILADPNDLLFADAAAILGRMKPTLERLTPGEQGRILEGLRRRLSSPPWQEASPWHLGEAPASVAQAPAALRALRENDPRRFAWIVGAAALDELRGPAEAELTPALWHALFDRVFVVGAAAAELAARRLGAERVLAAVLETDLPPLRRLRALGRLSGPPDVLARAGEAIEPFIASPDPTLQAAAWEAHNQLALRPELALQPLLLRLASADGLPRRGGTRPEPTREPVEVVFVPAGGAAVESVLAMLETAGESLVEHQPRIPRTLLRFAYRDGAVLLMRDIVRDPTLGEDEPFYSFLVHLTHLLYQAKLFSPIALHRGMLSLDKDEDGYWEFRERLLEIPYEYAQHAPPGAVVATPAMGQTLRSLYPMQDTVRWIGSRKLAPGIVREVFDLYAPEVMGIERKPWPAAQV